MNILCTYATSNMKHAAERLLASAGRHGIDDAYFWQPGDLGADFKAFNKDILSQPRGAGYWLWKPYIILRTMMMAKDGDVVMYSDAALEMNAHIRHLLASMDQDVLLFGNTHPHWNYCKGYARDVMGLGEIKKDIEQVQATVCIFKVNAYTIDFVKDWLLWCQMSFMIDDTHVPNTYDVATFVEHRHDQAILTNMAILHGIKLHWWAAQYNHGNHVRYADKYPFPMFIHHGQRDDGSRHTHQATIIN